MAWRKFLARIRETRSFEEALDGLRFVDVREAVGDIVFEISRRGARRRVDSTDRKWWVSCCGDHRFNESEDPSESQVLRLQDYVHDGLKHLWFATGLMGKHADFPWLVGVDQSAFFLNKSALLRDVGTALVGWLPEITSIAPRLTTSWSAPSRPTASHCPEWIVKFLVSICMCGFKLDSFDEIWAETFCLRQGDLTRFLRLRAMIIPSDGERHRLA